MLTTVGSLLDGLSSSNEVSHAEILQTCVGASLSSSTFQDKEDKDLTNVLTEDDVEEQLFEDEEEEVSTLNFNRTLFQISNNWHLSTILNLLELTEYTIHRNIECCLKKTVETKFEVGDKILTRNPTRSSGSIGGDPLVAPNVIAEIVEKVPGGMFKVILDDNSIHYQKAICTGEMVLFEKSKDLKAESGERNEMRNKKALLDAISNFA